MVTRLMIVDDEALARRRVRAMIQHRAEIEIVGEAATLAEATELVRIAAPDILLLDIGLAGESGFDLLPMLEGPVAPLVIFVTAFHQFAVRAFEANAVDYVLKPVAAERLYAALDRACAGLAQRDAQARLQEMTEVIAALRAHDAGEAPGPAYYDEFWVLHRGGHVRVQTARLDWVEAERDYVRLHTAEGSYLMRETMAQMEQQLDPATFVRVHRSAFVRRSLIQVVRPGTYGKRKLILSNGAEIPVGRTYANAVRDLIARGSDS